MEIVRCAQEEPLGAAALGEPRDIGAGRGGMSTGTLPHLSPSVVVRKISGAISEQGADHAVAAATGLAGGGRGVVLGVVIQEPADHRLVGKMRKANASGAGRKSGTTRTLPIDPAVYLTRLLIDP